jgi:hypothetical protein
VRFLLFPLQVALLTSLFLTVDPNKVRSLSLIEQVLPKGVDVDVRSLLLHPPSSLPLPSLLPFPALFLILFRAVLPALSLLASPKSCTDLSLHSTPQPSRLRVVRLDGEDTESELVFPQVLVVPARPV